MPRSIPPPPRMMVIGLAVITLFSFLGGAWVGQAQKRKANQALTPPALSSVRLVIPTEEGALHLQEEYEQKGYHVTAHPIQVSIQVPSGFIVADRLEPIAANPAAEALAKVYHFPVATRQVSDGNILVQVGAVYATKKDAEHLADRLKQLGYIWHVEQNFAEKPKTEFEILIPHVSKEEVDTMKTALPARGVQVQINPTP